MPVLHPPAVGPWLTMKLCRGAMAQGTKRRIVHWKIHTHEDDKIQGQRRVVKCAFIIHRPTTVTVRCGTQARVTAAVTTITAGLAVFALEALLGLFDDQSLTAPDSVEQFVRSMSVPYMQRP